jgi:hypothetical protein
MTVQNPCVFPDGKLRHPEAPCVITRHDDPASTTIRFQFNNNPEACMTLTHEDFTLGDTVVVELPPGHGTIEMSRNIYEWLVHCHEYEYPKSV